MVRLRRTWSFAQRGGMMPGLERWRGAQEAHEIGAQEMAELMGETESESRG